MTTEGERQKGTRRGPPGEDCHRLRSENARLRTLLRALPERDRARTRTVCWADAALYRAKRAGRNRCIRAEDPG